MLELKAKIAARKAALAELLGLVGGLGPGRHHPLAH